MNFNRLNFWFQVHNIPIRLMNRAMAEQICSSLGAIVGQLETFEDVGVVFYQLELTIDILQPLCRGRHITLEDGEERWVAFKYEHLPNLCYWCGHLTHDDKDSEVWINCEGTLPIKSLQFGSWLRAKPFSATQKNVIKVPGFYAG